MSKRLKAHILGFLRYLSNPHERANEDLAISFFRHVFGNTFTRQKDAKHSDGYVPGTLVLELKGKTSDWLKGFFQGIAYRRDLDFSLVVVAAKHFLAVWKLSDIPQKYLLEVKRESGAPSSIGQRLGVKYSSQDKQFLGFATWHLSQQTAQYLKKESFEACLDDIEQFTQLIKSGKKTKLKVTPSNFTSVLEKMVSFFDPRAKIKAVRAFYSIIFGWDANATLQISSKHNDQATLNGEVITNLIPGKREDFKRFIENYSVQLENNENYDDFFAQFDKALDTVDQHFRRKHGIFFTDLDLSKFVMWFVKNQLGDIGKHYLVIDPACGSGNLVTNWRSPLELRHKVVSEIEPELLFAVEQRMKGDAWHHGKYTVVPKVSENRGLNFLDKDAKQYLDTIKQYLVEKGHKPNRPLAFLCNPPYRSDDDQAAGAIKYEIHPSIKDITGNDASSERYCCFLAQMRLICDAAEDSGLPGNSLLLLFTKSAWLTPRPVFEKPWFRLNNQFMDCRKTRCLSGPPDNRGYCAVDYATAQKLFFWFTIGRVFSSHGYPMWADALEMWPPHLSEEVLLETTKLCFAIGLAENECVETVYPANNPQKGAPELRVLNPMCPTNRNSFWSQTMGSIFTDNGKSSNDKLVRLVCNTYSEWNKKFIKNKEIPAPFHRQYFIDSGSLSPFCGLIQIKDYASETNDHSLKSGYDAIQEQLKIVKDRFYELLLDEKAINYFAEPSKGQVISIKLPHIDKTQIHHRQKNRKAKKASSTY